MKRLLLILAVATIHPAFAEVLVVPTEPAPRTTESGDLMPVPDVDRSHLPARGTDMDSVRSRYGEPLSTSPAVGEPPITRWVYDDFIVFFEYRHVINAVIPNKPAPIHNKEELRRGDY